MADLNFESFKVEKNSFTTSSGEVVDFFKITTNLNGACIRFRAFKKHTSILKYAYDNGFITKACKIVGIQKSFVNDKNKNCTYYDFLLTDTRKINIKLQLFEDDKALFNLLKDGALSYKL